MLEAIPTGMLSTNFRLEQESQLVGELDPSIWRCQATRKFGLFEGERQIGMIYPRGMFTKRANIDLPRQWPLANRVFMFWLVFLMWKRDSQAAS